MISLIRNYTHTFRRFWFSNTLNFVGLIVALSAFYLFTVEAGDMMSYDKCYEGWESIYRIEVEGNMFNEDTMLIANVFSPLSKAAIKTEHVTDAAVHPLANQYVDFYKDGQFKCSYPYITGYGKELNFWKKGTVPESLSDDFLNAETGQKDGVVIPRSFAEQYYGSTDVKGKTLAWEQLGEMFSYKIICVYEDFPKNCSVQNGIYRYEENADSLNYTNYNYHVFVRLDDNADSEEAERSIHKQLVNDVINLSDEDATEVKKFFSKIKIHLRPIHEAYYSRVDDTTDKGDDFVLNILIISALMAIIITNVNYMNFSLAEAPFRIKNINTRRVFGANRWVLMVELIMENVIVSLAAFAISMMLVWAVDRVSVTDVNPLSHIYVAVMTFVAALFIGTVSGGYPAYFATSAPPVISLKGKTALPMRSRRLRNIRIAFQMIMSFIALEVSLTLVLQGLYVSFSDYGFDKEQVLYGVLNSKDAMNRKEELKEVIESTEGVQSVGYSKFMLGTDDRYMMWSRESAVHDGTILFTIMPVSSQYIQTMGIELLDGRRFCPSDSLGAYIINEAAVKKYPWIKLGNSIFAEGYYNYPVVGICKNIQFASMRYDTECMPLAFVYSTDWKDESFANMNCISIRISDKGKVDKVGSMIEKSYSKMFPDDSPMRLITLDNELSHLYNNEMTVFIHTLMFALIYIFITLVGVACTIMFESEFHRKEITMRKVFGASRKDILFHMFHLYVILTVSVFVLSIPLAEMASDAILKTHVRQFPYLWIAYPISFVLLTAITFATILIQRNRYAKEKPVEAINL